MKRIIVLLASATLIAGPVLAQPVSNEAPPEDTAPPPAAALVQPATPTPAAEPAPTAPPAPPAAASGVYQVLRPGDRQMTCESLANEANTLNAELIADQEAAAKAAKKKKAGKGLMGGATGGLLAGAARYGVAKGMIGGAISAPLANAVVSVTDNTAMAAGKAVAESGDTEAPATVSPKQQRMNYLLTLYREKSC